MVPELHALRIVCLLKAVTLSWVINTIPFLLEIDCLRYHGSFEVLQAKVKCPLSVGPASPVPPTLNKHFSARGGQFMYLSCILLREGR